MAVLIGLDGISENERVVGFIDHHSDIQVLINNKMAATASGSNGAINIWEDDNGKIRCEAMVFMHVKSSEIFDNIFMAQVWFDNWMERIN